MIKNPDLSFTWHSARHFRALTQTKKACLWITHFSHGHFSTGQICSRGCCSVKVCHAFKKDKKKKVEKKKSKEDLHECEGVLRELSSIWKKIEGTERKQSCTEKATRKIQLKGEGKNSQDSPEKWKSKNQMLCRQISLLEQLAQACPNSTAAINAWLHGGKRDTKSLITE